MILHGEQARQVFAAGNARGAQGHRCAVADGRIRVERTGEKLGDPVEFLKGTRHGQLPLVFFLKHAPVDGTFKQVPAIEEHMRAGRMGQTVERAAYMRTARRDAGEEAGEILSDAGIDFLKRAQDSAGEPAHPGDVQAKNVKAGGLAQVAVEFVDLIVGEDGNVDGNARMTRIEPGHGSHDFCGRAVQCGDFEHIRLRFLRWRGGHPGAKTGIFKQMHAGRLALFNPADEPARGVVAQQAIVEFVLAVVRLRHGQQRRERVKLRQRIGIERAENIARSVRQLQLSAYDCLGAGQIRNLQQILMTAQAACLQVEDLAVRPVKRLHEPGAEVSVAGQLQAAHQQNHAFMSGRKHAAAQIASGLRVVKPDIVGLKIGPLLHIEHGHFAGNRLGAQMLRAGKQCNAGNHIALRLVQEGGFGVLAAGAGDILAHAVSVAFCIGLEAEIEIDICLGIQVGEQRAQQPGVALTQQLGALVGHIAKLAADLLHQTDFFAGNIAASVQHVGYGALRDAGSLGDILDGDHGGSLLLQILVF